ncbi:MAG: APC family permease [Gammaproteobacteria bacterium]|nr:APC family permease [Gammaproteobacteria bacterium]
MGIGGMVGGGIFAVLGTAVAYAHGGTPVAFLFSGIIALLTAYSYAKLSVTYPSQGGTVSYIDRAFGVDLLTGAVNLMLWLSYLVTIALYASAFGSYGTTFFSNTPSSWLKHVIISMGIILPTLINLFNADIVSKAETFIVVIKIALLAVVIVAGAGYVDIPRVSPENWSDPLSLIAAGMVIFVAYEGFELIANTAQEVREPERTLPRAFFSSVIIVVILYILVALVTVGSVSPDKVAEAKDYVLAVAAEPALGHTGFTLVAVAALLATFSAINATIYGNARLGFSLAKDGELPEILERKVWSRPVYGVLLTAGLSLFLANLVDLTAIAIMGSAGFLIIFAAVNAANVKLAAETGGNRIIASLGFLACLCALAVLIYHTSEDNAHALWIILVMVVVSFLFELVYPRISGRKLSF